MRPSHHRTLQLLLTTVLLLLTTACASDAAADPPAPLRVSRCVTVHPKGTCHPVLGVTPPYPSIASLTVAENRLHHHFRLVHTFHPVTATIPSAYEKYVVTHGALLHVSIDAYAGSGASRHWVTWRSIANHRYDRLLTRQARNIKRLHVPVLLTFEHEPDQAAKTNRGTPADFVAAWRHVHRIYANARVRNVVWVWVMTGWPGNFDRNLRMWPGNSEVDWVGWDPYDTSGCWPSPGKPRSFASVATPFLHWWWSVQGTHGIPRFKPLMISETGSGIRAGAMWNKTWFAGILPFLRKHHAIRAVSLWDHADTTSRCTFQFDDIASAVTAFHTMARAAYWLD